MGQKSINLGEEYLIPDYALFDAGVYATASKILGLWNLSGGLRFDYRYLDAKGLIEDDEVRFEDFTRHFYGITGSLGATCEVAEGLDLKFNLARGYRAPNISANGEHEGSLRYEVGNHNFKPEYSLQADLGLNYATRYFELNAAVFANHISNYIYLHRIDSIIEPDLMTFAYAQGEAMLMGFEAGVDVHPFHALHVGAAFSYVNAQLLHQPEETRWLPMTPAPRLSADVKYELTHDGKVFNNAYFAARMDLCLKQDHYYAAYDTETATPSYLLLGLSAGTEILIKGKKVAENGKYLLPFEKAAIFSVRGSMHVKPFTVDQLKMHLTGGAHRVIHPITTSNTIISTKPTAKPIVLRLECSPDEASGISSSTTT